MAEIDEPKQILHSKPRGALRVKHWAIIGSLLFIVFILMSSSRSPLHVSYLSFFCFLALVLAVIEGKKIWNLRAKKISRSTSLFIGLTLVAVFVALLALNDSGIFIWNQLYLDIPLTLFFLLRGVIAWITEWRKSVQVYEELEGFTFVLKK